MKDKLKKKRIPLIILAAILSAAVLCGFDIVPEVAELKQTKPFIDLDLLVKDSVGTTGAEEVIKEEETPAPSVAPGTDAEKEIIDIRVEVRQDLIKLDNVWCDGFDDFTVRFEAKYNRNMTVRLIDDYADAITYRKVQSLFRKHEITPVREQVGD